VGSVGDQEALNSSPSSQVRGSSWVDQVTARITVKAHFPCLLPSQFRFALVIRGDRVPLSTIGVSSMADRRSARLGATWSHDVEGRKKGSHSQMGCGWLGLDCRIPLRALDLGRRIDRTARSIGNPH
jgi:hypothetical protein